MDSTEYAPGTVAVATVRGVKGVRVFRYEDVYGHHRWDSAEPLNHVVVHPDSDVADVRPLVVLDLDGHSPTVLADQLTREGFGDIADQIEAQTKPPRIPEPGLWGVVEAKRSVASKPTRWVHTPTSINQPWVSVDADATSPWSDLIDPTLIREGLS